MPRRLVTDRAAADALRGGATQLRPFVGRECSVSAAAQELGLPMHRMYYWVRRLQDAGLLEVVREVPRGGRAIKLYRAVADSFEVPPELLPEGALTQNLRTEAAGIARGIEAELALDLHDVALHVDFPEQDGRRSPRSEYSPRRILARPESAPPSTWRTSAWWLSEADAEALIAAVGEVLDGFEGRRVDPGAPGARRFRSVFGVAPDAE